MEGGEIQNFIKVWLTVFASLSYCYAISNKLAPKGLVRLLTILPVVCLFLALPLNLTSVHLGSITAFFISWLANFKLLLFAFGKGPLSSHPSISLVRFVAIGCLPIKIITQQQPKVDQIDGNPSQIGQNKQYPPPKTTKNGSKQSPLNYAIKILLLAMMSRVYAYGEYVHPTVIWTMYCVHVYFCLDIVLAMVAATARALLGLELEQQFNEPYLSTSLHDFWGRRWNIIFMATTILRSSVYEPVHYFSTWLVGRKWASLPAVLSTFVVSGLMHDLIFYYLGRTKPTWEITWFFVINGVCLVAEIGVKKILNGRYRVHVHPMISRFMTVGFVAATGVWLFVPQFLRCKADERAVEEYAALGAFMEDVGRTFKSKFINMTRVV